MKLPTYLFLFVFSAGLHAQTIDLHFDETVVKEGDQAPDVYTAQIKLSQASEKTVSVSYKTQDGQAVAGEDYEGRQGSVTFSPGETLKLVQFYTVPDKNAEPYLEQFEFQIHNPVNASLGKSTEILTIEEDDISISLEAGPQIVEGDSGETKTAVFTIKSKHSYGKDFLVGFRTLNDKGSASAGVDFIEEYSTLAFADGELAKTFEISVIGDGDIEANETFAVEIWSPDERVSVERDQIEGYITDDDGDLYFSYNTSLKILANNNSITAMVGVSSGRIPLEKKTLEDGKVVFQSKSVSFPHTTTMYRVGAIGAIPGASSVLFKSEDGSYTAESMTANWAVNPPPRCKIPFFGVQDCPWIAAMVEGFRPNYAPPSNSAPKGHFILKGWQEVNTTGEAGVTVVRKVFNKTFSVNGNDTNVMKTTFKIIRK